MLEAVRSLVINMSMKNDVSWSDHYPIKLKCNLNILEPKLVNNLMQKNKMIEGIGANNKFQLYTN